MEHILEATGTLVGLVYLWLEYRASIYLWVAGIVMPAIYLFVYYRAGLYADFGINVYYLLAAVYGWTRWRYGAAFPRRRSASPAGTEASLPISHLPPRYVLPLALVFVIAFIGIAQLLIQATDSNVPWLDAFTTALSLVGLWMLARKYIEQWWVWVAVDVVSSGLYFYKNLNFTAILYALYGIIAIFGYSKWEKIMKEKDKI